MNRYPPSSFRPAFGVAAVALSALTLAVFVVLPMGMAQACSETTLAALPIEVTISPARIDVVASPSRAVALEPVNVVGRSRNRAG